MANDFLRYLSSDPRNWKVALYRGVVMVFVALILGLVVRLTVVSQQNAARLVDVAKTVGAQ